MPGCASGEEAYSIAMVLLELIEEAPDAHEQEIKIQIYATDLDEDAIAVARRGHYPSNIAQEVNPERLRRFFVKDEAGYKIKQAVRERVVFAVHNVIKDPPFIKLDLISCRNLMIYLEPELQSQLIPNFHYCLKPDGVLLLSPSESIGGHSELFSAIDRRWKIYRAKHAVVATHPGHSDQRPLAAGNGRGRARYADTAVITRPKANSAVREGMVADLSHRVLLETYAPASVTTDARGNILFVHGDTGRYLRPAPGPISNDVIEMAREGLQRELRAAIDNAAAHATPTLDREVLMKTNGGFTRVNFNVKLLPGQHDAAAKEAGEPLLLVSFQDVAESGNPVRKPSAKLGRGKGSAALAEVQRAAHLERELAYARENLKGMIEERQLLNEELTSTNEELQSANEELQSSNEELETSNEELQSLNEETITVNSELNARVGLLSTMREDMQNLLDSISTGVLFLDSQLAIQSYTPEAAKVYRLIATDIGRPLSDIISSIEGGGLLSELHGVLDTHIPNEFEVHTLEGEWYLVRMKPYLTLDRVIAGVVLTLTPVTQFKVTRMKLAEAQEARSLLAEGIVNTVREPLIVLDGSLQVISASRSFYRHFQVSPEETVGYKIYSLGNGQWNIRALRQLLGDILLREETIEGYVMEHDFPGLGRRQMTLNARRIVTAAGNTELILLAIEPLDKT